MPVASAFARWPAARVAARAVVRADDRVRAAVRFAALRCRVAAARLALALRCVLVRLAVVRRVVVPRALVRRLVPLVRRVVPLVRRFVPLVRRVVLLWVVRWSAMVGPRLLASRPDESLALAAASSSAL
jgi:hypothetical protein